MNRRDLLKAGVSILPVASRLGIGGIAAGVVTAETRADEMLETSSQSATANSTLPWQRRIRRVGQLNMTEHDPAVMDVEAWADFWANVKADVIFISPNRSHEEPRLIRTCMFTGYMTDYIPAIIREVNTTYDVDAFYCNGWPPLGELPNCHCSVCKDLPPSGTPAYWDKFNDRMEFLWTTYNSLAKEKKPDSFFFANSGGGARSAMNLDRLGKICDWFQGDNQGRGGQDEPVWLCTLQGRVATAIQEGKMATNITGTWSTGPVRWRNTAKSPQESMIWTSQTSAAGLVPYFHVIGAETGLGEDRRWQTLVRNYFDWSMKHDRHFANKRTIAKLGVVMGQRTHMFYKYPPSAGLNSALNEPTQQALNGMYYALLEGRFLFDFVHEDRMDAERLSKYSALVLPNVALLSDAQCEQLRAYVKGGGSLLATFETSMYDERNNRRENFGLADVLGIHKSGDVVGTTGNGYYSRIERKHEILEGFADTNWFMGAEHRLPIAPVANPVLTVVPGFVAYPPELAYPPESHTNEPAIVVSEQSKSRVAYFSGDLERTFWTSGQPDLSRLIHNTIRWMLRSEQPVSVEGNGLIETFAWETEPGFALHILNYTNPNTHRGWYRDFYPIGAQRIRFDLPSGRKVSRVQLLRAEKDIPFKRTAAGVEFTIPSVTEYEIAAIET